MSDVTRILHAIDQGDPHASEQLLPLVYDELRQLAAHKLSAEKAGQTLQATALVHEAYLRLVDGEHSPRWNGRGHFFAAAANAMQRILVDNARRKQAEKHGGGRRRIDLSEVERILEAPPEAVLGLGEALECLKQHDALAGQLVGLLYFTGLSVEQAAEALGMSRATAYRLWTFARAWLACRLEGG